MVDVKCIKCKATKKVDNSKIVITVNGRCRVSDKCSKCKGTLSSFVACPPSLREKAAKVKAKYDKDKLKTSKGTVVKTTVRTTLKPVAKKTTTTKKPTTKKTTAKKVGRGTTTTRTVAKKPAVKKTTTKK